MSSKQSKSTIDSRDSSPLSQTRFIPPNYIQVYKIKVDQIPNPSKQNLSQRNIYLNVIFSDKTDAIFQTQCINIMKDNKFFEIRTRNDIEKIEVLDYQNLKKLCKVSFKGIKKEFKHSHVEAKSEIQVQIQRIHNDLNVCNIQCKLVESVIMEKVIKSKYQESTDDSSSEVSN